MKLNLKIRQIEIPDKDGKPTGIKAMCKPLATWAVQEWGDYTRLKDLATATGTDATALVKRVLKEHVTQLDGLKAITETGERDATLDEMLDSAQTANLGVFLMVELFKSSVLTEAEAGN